MSIPFLWMTEYDPILDMCDLDVTCNYLNYIITLNIIFVSIPMFVLTYFYISIIINSKKNYKSLKNLFVYKQLPKNEKRQTSSEKLPRKSLDLGNKIKRPTSLKEFSIQNFSRRETVAFFLKEEHKSQVKDERVCKSVNYASNPNHTLDLIFKLKAKQKYESTTKISILTILSFWCQVPIRLFTCWFYISLYSSKFGEKYYDNFIDKNSKSIYIYYNVSTIVYFLNFVFNCTIYNIFSVQFRKEFKKFWGF